MSVVHVIDTLTEWAQRNICDHVQLKKPPMNLEANDEGYSYETVKPAVFPMYVPTSEKLPPSIHSPFPSLCVRFLKGSDDLKGSKGYLDVQFCFSAWDPGTHGQDIVHAYGATPYSEQGKQEATFERNGNGWRDVWNFVDTALRAVESVTKIGGYTIDRETPVEFGPLTEQEAIADYYPFWFAWMSFRVNYPLQRNVKDLKDVEKYL
jgi:hypothetical protein